MNKVAKLVCALIIGLPVFAQTPSSAEADLLALLNTPVTVASAKAMSLRESPGAISYITRDEILASGALQKNNITLPDTVLKIGKPLR